MTERDLIGIESKRFEPFRDAKQTRFSATYDRPRFGDRMSRYSGVRHDLAKGALRYEHLDAAQLVKHAYGLRTDGVRLTLAPTLFYLFAEPSARGDRPINPAAHRRHRDELADFAERVEGDEVAFAAASYREWLAMWGGSTAEHATNLLSRFVP